MRQFLKIQFLAILFCASFLPLKPAWGSNNCRLQEIFNGTVPPLHDEIHEGTGFRVKRSPIDADADDTTEIFAVLDRRTKTTCSIREELVSGIYMSRDEGTLILRSNSGSMTGLTFYDTKTCKPKFGSWDDWKALSWGELREDKISNKGDCDCYELDDSHRDHCTCSSAQVYELRGSDCRPVLLRKESLELTKKSFGVGFEGKALIASPGTKKVKLLRPLPDQITGQKGAE